MSRLKLILLVIIIAILGIVFVQNREPMALKLLCPDSAEFCLYQTPDLPLAIWMALFIVGGVITSLLTQVFNRYRYGSARTRPNSVDFAEDRNKWSTKASKQDRYSNSPETIEDSKIQDKYRSGNYEAPQKPESVERSGSTYSYKYRDAKNESDNPQLKRENNGNRTSLESEINSKVNLDKDDEDWI